jgi:eukaryotic-like serine/threonine-protein kinase
LALTAGTRLGVYQITAPIGEGGMGQVWRATDTTLGRQVAIKILPDAFAADPERLARFEREAKTLASLNHPHIAAIYGFEKSSGVHALVMELIEGDDLSQRIKKGAIPLDEALPIAKQIAEALEAAHEQGIIHRDLKPANIKVRADGTVKVLDFGLAKAMDAPAGSSPHVSQSPTITTPAMTQAGMILGTAAYMAPEQAKGRPVDRRADIWAFGAVLFEMLSGTRAFRGEDVTDTIVSVISKEPDWSAVPAATPARLRQLLTRCLKKDAKTRLQAIGDARVPIDELLSGAPEDWGGSLPAIPTTTASSRGRLPWMVAAAAVVGMIALAVPAVRYLRQPAPSTPPEMRLEIATPATDVPLDFALSPDGRSLVFVASGDGPTRLWLRPFDQTEARPLAGTEGASYPFWSPDGRSVGFFANTRLLRLDIAGGAPDVLATLTGVSNGGSWSTDGSIVFSRQLTGPLWRVPGTGGDPVAVTQLDPPRQISHRHPQFLPDGRQFLFHAEGAPETAGIYLGSLDGGAPTRLTAADSAGAFLPPDRVVFVRQGTLVARRLDLTGRALTGEPVTLAEGVGVDRYFRGGVAVSGARQVAYRAAGESSTRQLTWLDRTGKSVGVAGEPDASDLSTPALSPDGRRVAMRRAVQGNLDIWLLDFLRTGLTRLTFHAAGEYSPVWSPDGIRIAFNSNRTGAYNLYVKSSNGAGAEVRLGPPANNKAPTDWSADGRWLLYWEVHPTTGRDAWALDMTSPDYTPRVIANTPAEEAIPALSPDGRWVAYQTNESGRFEVVVQSFPDAGGKWQVSTAGGVAPGWRADGKELFFLAPDSTLMAAPVIALGASFEAGTPVALFRTRSVEGGSTTGQKHYAVARDGRFLINQPVADATAAPITLILNWNPEAKQ